MFAGAPSTIVSTAQIGDGVIVNADINAAAAIAESKIAFATNDGSRHDHHADDIAAGTLGVTRGGTGISNPTAKSLLVGNGASALAYIAPGSSGQVLKSDGTDWQAGSAPAGLTNISNTDTNLTGSASETTLWSDTLPANSIGANGFVRIRINWEAANDGGGAGTQTLRIKYGGTTLATHSRSSTSGAQGQISEVTFINQNATNSQAADNIHFANDGASPSLKAFGTEATAAIDSTSAQTLLVSGQLSNTAHHIKITRVTVECFFKS